MKIEQIKVKDIIHYNKNTKKHPDEQIVKIANSIREFGFNVPVLLDKNNVIIAGHGRLYAANKLGLDEVPCFRLDDLTPEQVKAYRIADNKTAESEWEESLLIEEINDLMEANYDIELTGFSKDEIAALYPDNINPVEVEAEDPEEIETTIKIGDVFMLGDHRLMCGDSTSSEDVAILMQDEKADMVLTDPPYGINIQGDNSKRGSKTSLMKGGLKLHNFIDDSTDYAIKAFNICQDYNITKQVWWGANYYCHSIPETNNWLVWDKRVEEKMRNTNSDCELAWVLDGHQSVRIFRHLWNGLIKASENNERRVHPTQKPIALMMYCINEYGKDCDIIIDLFGGSGSTLIACEQTDRKCRMMELDPKYCEVICRRWEKLTEKERVCLNENK